MDKRGAMQLKADNDAVAYDKALDYWCALPNCEPFAIVRYRTDRGADYGVIVNIGEKVHVWNALKDKIEQYSLSEFEGRKLELEGNSLKLSA